LKRSSIIEKLKGESEWDIIVIGGGATGLGTALDAASRGFKTALIEQHDFAKGTSSRSTKLVHGGVRYLRQGNISLVLDALKERGLLLRNAPHIVKKQSFIVPNYKWWEKPFYGIGLKLYDKLAGNLGFGKSTILNAEQTIDEIPTIEPHNLSGGVRYFDGQFDDARLAINLMQTITEQGGTAINYVKAVGLLKTNGSVRGVKAQDIETGDIFELPAKSVVNATGVFTDTLRQMDVPQTQPIIEVSQGVHIVLDREFQPGESAMMIPKTDDGRVLFAVPWHNKVIIGTTDTPVERAELEPCALEQELDFLLSHAAKYLSRDPTASDVKSVFTGLRPLVKNPGKSSTKKLSRDHTIIVDPSGLITITGGKWTTYRKMAEDTVDHAIEAAGLPEKKSATETLKIHGWAEHLSDNDPYHIYGSDAESIHKLAKENKGWDELLHPDLPYHIAELIWSIRHEQARTVEDLLSRRTRALLLDAKACIDIAEKVAGLIAGELNYNGKWIDEETTRFKAVAENYLFKSKSR
jgi:glycerol-3-phosphate dehydrogenase